MSYNSCIKNINVECGNLDSNKKGIEAVHEGLSQLKIQILNVLKQKDSKWIVFLISCNSVVIYYLWNWSLSTDSLALKAYTNTVEFNVCALAVCLISIWVEQHHTLNGQSRARNEYDADAAQASRANKFSVELPGCKSSGASKPPQEQPKFRDKRSASSVAVSDGRKAGAAAVARLNDCRQSDLTSIAVLGLEKYEVFALLVSSCLSLITGFLVAIDACARIRDQPIVHEGRLGLGAVLGLIAHLVTIVAYPDAGLNHVVCKALPCPTFKGINPILGGNLIGFTILCGAHTAINHWELYIVDTAAAFAVVSLIVASMLPLAFFAASIILQKLSHHMNEQLDKCLREALIIDGVLEFRNERFWTKSFGKLAGSLEVRIRKNADESYVLHNVMKRLSQVVSTLRVQEFREPSSSVALNSSATCLPLEYYIDELLPFQGGELLRKKNAAADENQVPEETVKINEILGCANSSFEDKIPKQSVKIQDLLNCASSSRSDKFASKSSRDGPLLPGYATLLTNTAPKKPERNAILLGSRFDLDDLHCTTKLFRQTSLPAHVRLDMQENRNESRNIERSNFF